MARWTFEGMDKYIIELNKLESNTDAIIGHAVHDGAGIVADAVRGNIEALPAVADGIGAHAYKAGTGVPLTETTKQGLLDGFGISKIQRKNGYHHVKLGFDGYNKLKTKRFPKGQPNVLIARSLEFGSSISRKHPFVKPAVAATKGACEQRMADVIDQEIETLMK